MKKSTTKKSEFTIKELVEKAHAMATHEHWQVSQDDQVSTTEARLRFCEVSRDFSPASLYPSIKLAKDLTYRNSDNEECGTAYLLDGDLMIEITHSQGEFCDENYDAYLNIDVRKLNQSDDAEQVIHERYLEIAENVCTAVFSKDIFPGAVEVMSAKLASDGQRNLLEMLQNKIAAALLKV